MKKQKVRIRRSVRHIYFIIGILLLVVPSVHLASNFGQKNIVNTTKEIYSYTNNFLYNYTVNLKNNKYISDKALGKEYQAYVTDLIDNIDLDLNFNFKADKTSKLNYEYKVIGRLEGSYSKDGETQKVWQEEEIILDSKSDKVTSDKFNINEKIKLDLGTKNDLVKSFENQLKMSIDVKYNVVLEVKANTIIEDEIVSCNEEKVVSIDLGEKTTQIKGDDNKENSKYVTKEIEQEESTTTENVIYIVMFIIAILILRYVSKTQGTNRIKNEYKQEVNRILRLCQDKIVKLDTKLQYNEENVIKVKDFGEIVKLSEELFKPILYWEDKEHEEAHFMVMSNNVIYRFVLKK